MRFILALLLVLFQCSTLLAQTNRTIAVNGSLVAGSNYTGGLSGISLTIKDSCQSGVTVHTTVTNSNGFYMDSIQLGYYQGKIIVSLQDCNGNTMKKTYSYGPTTNAT